MSTSTPSMDDVVRTAFRQSLETLASELKIMPLSRWNESVFRYYFCRSIALAYPDVEQFVECKEIDLVLAQPSSRAFIEFKFYTHPHKFDAYSGRRIGYKGYPGSKNLGEFRDCIDKLHGRVSVSGLSKYIVLVYADPNDGRRPGRRYATYYDEYRHARDDVMIRLIETSADIAPSDAIIRAKLYEICVA
jgi:hypothetical protein